MKQIPNTLLVVFLLVAFIGFADATYLTAKHYIGEIPPCSIVSGCETVLTSPYATIVWNIPVALMGAFYYFVLFMGGILYVDTKNSIIIKIAAYFTAVGFIISVILVCIQIFVIRALCLYCIVSAITSTVLFILGVVILKKLKQTDTIGAMPILMR